jgi:hypothetical protein
MRSGKQLGGAGVAAKNTSGEDAAGKRDSAGVRKRRTILSRELALIAGRKKRRIK